jgi:hypothetical protein
VTNKSLTCGANITGQTWDQGSNTIIIYANDTIGNENKSSITFIADTAYPEISIISPLNNTNTTNINIPVNYIVSDSSLQACKWTNNSGAVNKTITCGTNITGQTWDQGSNTVIIYANDSFGNENSSSITFTVDSISPTISIVQPTSTPL